MAKIPEGPEGTEYPPIGGGFNPAPVTPPRLSKTRKVSWTFLAAMAAAIILIGLLFG